MRPPSKNSQSNGYAAARLDKVAERANVGKGTIYLYFASKHRLFQEVVRDLIRPVHENFELWVKNSPASACRLLEDLISKQYAEVVTNRKAQAILRLLIAESGKFPELSDIYYREAVQPGIRAFQLVLEKGIASGEFHAIGARAFPQILAAPAVLALVWILTLGTRADLGWEMYRAAYVEFILSALRSGACVEASRTARFVGFQGEHS